MKNKKIEQLKTTLDNYLKNADIKQLKEYIKNLPPEMLQLFKTIMKKSKYEK